MNKNIKIINDYLYAVNFDYIYNGYIKELSFITKSCSDLVCITREGIMIINSGDIHGEKSILLIEQIMNLSNDEIGEESGYIKCLRGIISSASEFDDHRLLKIVENSGAGNFIETYRVLCKWETVRREAASEYENGNNKIKIKNPFRKGGKGHGRN